MRWGTSAIAQWVVTCETRIVVVRQHHHRVALAGQVGQQLGVAFEGVARQVQRLLRQRRGHDGIGQPSLHPLGGAGPRRGRPIRPPRR
jgi:hypothetical protein